MGGGGGPQGLGLTILGVCCGLWASLPVHCPPQPQSLSKLPLLLSPGAQLQLRVLPVLSPPSSPPGIQQIRLEQCSGPHLLWDTGTSQEPVQARPVLLCGRDGH